MKTRILQTKFWIDSFVVTLTPEEKLIFNYYLTNDKVNIIHFYECSDRQVMFDTGVSTGVLQGCKDKLTLNNKILFYKDFVLLINARKYEHYEGADNLKAKGVLLGQLSKDVLEFYKKHTPLSTGVYTLPINHNTKTINNKSETISHKSENDLQGLKLMKKKLASLKGLGGEK